MGDHSKTAIQTPLENVNHTIGEIKSMSPILASLCKTAFWDWLGFWHAGLLLYQLRKIRRVIPRTTHGRK